MIEKADPAETSSIRRQVSAEAYGINGFGDVVGVSSMSQRRSGLQHAFLATPLGMADLGALKGKSVARDINDAGFVVGASGGGVSVHAVLWRLP